MLAVIKTGGKQYKVEIGQELMVERLGKKDETKQLPDLLSGKAVIVKILDEIKGEKATTFKFHRRKRYRRNLGHRQVYSKIKIEQIK